MNIQLPPDITGSVKEIPSVARQITIIGANGSGKSRFTKHLVDSLGSRAFCLSALEALYGNTEQNTSIDRLFHSAEQSTAFLHNNANSTFDRLMALLLNEEIATLVQFKVAKLESGKTKQVLPETKLDAVVRNWQEIFSDNRILREGGRLLFTRSGTEDAYSQVKLSDGEKTVLFFFGAILYAPPKSVVFIENPGMFLHPTVTQRLWDRIESIRPDCRFIYTTHDLDFAASRSANTTVWVRSYDPASVKWDYALLPRDSGISEEVYMAIIGARKPVLFVEGDATHSIDSKLYPLVFKDYTVKALGSCNRVIEATRTFNDLRDFHHLDSRGIVDRDRRDEMEVGYLRRKKIYVPNVAEIENILMLEEVVRTVAGYCERDEEKVFRSVRNAIIGQFKAELHKQALMHTRHRVKRLMECRVDGRFNSINALEKHISGLVNEINPRGLYAQFCRDFSRYVTQSDYAAILRVYNQKSMISASNVAALCGLSSAKDAYVSTILSILKADGPEAIRMRRAITASFGL